MSKHDKEVQPQWTARNSEECAGFNPQPRSYAIPIYPIVRFADRKSSQLAHHALRSAGLIKPHCEEPTDTGNIPATVIMRDGCRFDIKTNGKMPHDAVGYILNGRAE